MRRTVMKARNRVLHFVVVPLALAVVASGAAPLRSRVLSQVSRLASAESECRLGAQEDIRRVVFIQFDNVHFRRDVPNVPSDLEQMPHLLSFITDNGTLLTDDHTVLISHTATGFLSTITGLYPDRMGQPVANSYRYFTRTGASRLAVSFAYWTAPVFDVNPAGQTDFTPTMIDERGKVAPAPWVAYTRSQCDVGIVGMANTVLENIAIDIPTVFGPNSPEAAAVQADSKQAFADFVGIGVHCAQESALCAASAHARPDRLPDEPGGYDGYMALFGHRYVAPVISPDRPLTDINGTAIADSGGRLGFPGWDSLTGAVALGYTATMLEAGIPVTYTYISDAHDQNPPPPTHVAFGPGEAGYVTQLRAYDDAFGKFFARLAADGITPGNTLFVFSADEGDHFVGGPASPSGCNGVTTPCTYPVLGEVNLNLRGLLAVQRGNTTAFMVHADAAPTIYIDGNPGPSDPVTRRLEQDANQLRVTNPISGAVELVTEALAGPAEMKLLHMVTSDPFRTPTFTLFGRPDYFFFRGAANCTSSCAAVQRAFAWSHGTIDPVIMQTWVGFVGPGVLRAGPTNAVWADHADVRPTMLALLGVQDMYISDGRVLAEILSPRGLPHSLRTDRETFIQLAALYKKINAPIGDLARASLSVSTRALATIDEPTYSRLTQQLQDWTKERDRLAARMKAILYAAAFGGDPISEGEAHALIAAGENLLDRVQNAAASIP
jgi:hypothetical protein